MDPALPAKLRAELPGILAWAVQGCLSWQTNRLGRPTAIIEALSDYRREMDVIGQFLSEQCAVVRGAAVSKALLYDAYKTWCDTSGEHTLTKIAFGKRLTERGLESFSTGPNVSMWRGIGLRNI